MADVTGSSIDATRRELIEHALTLYPFRDIRSDEQRPTYLRALVEHVQDHDWGLAFEILFGKRQVDWTPDETRRFVEHMTNRPMPTNKAPATLDELDITPPESGGIWPVTDEAMDEMLTEMMTALLDWRRDQPTKSLPVMIAVLMMTGEMTFAQVGRGDRVRALKYLAQHAPVYGYVIAFDAFMHTIDGSSRATKTDCILGHVGTRTLRRTRRMPYRYMDDRRRIEVLPQLPDFTPNADNEAVDPYAEIFVSVPTSDRPS